MEPEKQPSSTPLCVAPKSSLHLQEASLDSTLLLGNKPLLLSKPQEEGLFWPLEAEVMGRGGWWAELAIGADGGHLSPLSFWE